MSAVSGNDAGEGETDDLVTRFLPASTQVTFGAASGTAAGYALRQGGKVAGVVLGGGFIFVQSLAYLGTWTKPQSRLTSHDSRGNMSCNMAENIC